MWCRTILTAVAISYVICMLVLSGLQKEDLDANTLEKLRRHNVNIDDMNNENRRQECILNSDTSKGNDTQTYITTENINEALGMIKINKSIENGVVAEYPEQKMRVLKDLEHTTTIQNETENNKTRFFRRLQKTDENSKKNDVIDNSGEETKVKENNGLQMQYMKDIPDIESIMKFWTKVKQYTKGSKVVPKVPTTPSSSYISEERNVTVKIQTTHNNGYVHSREMEFISRMLAEYLASQTVPTTTQRISTEKPYMDIIPTKITEMQKLETLNDNLNKLNNFTPNDEPSRKVIFNYTSDENKRTSFKVTDSKGQTKNIEDTPYSQILSFKTKTGDTKPVKKNNPIRFLDNLLQMNNDYHISGEPIPFIEASTKSITLLINDTDSERQEKSETFDKYGSFQYMNDINNSNSKHFIRNQNVIMSNIKFSSVPIKAQGWEPIRNNIMVNKQFKIIPIEEDRAQEQNFEINNVAVINKSEQPENSSLYDQYQAAPSNITYNSKLIKKSRTYRFHDIPTDINRSEQIQNDNFNNNQYKVRPVDTKIGEQNQNFETENDRFQPIQPSIEKLKQNQNFEMKNYPFQPLPPIIKNSKQNQNIEIEKYRFQPIPPTIINSKQRQVFDIEKKSKQNQNNKMENDRIQFLLPSIKSKQNENNDIQNVSFQPMPPSIKKSKQNQNYEMENDQVQFLSPSIKSNQNQNNFIENDSFQLMPPSIKKSKQNQNYEMKNDQIQFLSPSIKSKQNQNIDIENDSFQPMPPSIKKPKENQYLKSNNTQLKRTLTELNKTEQVQNSGMYGDQYKPVITETNKSERDQMTKMNNDQYNANPEIRNTEQNSKGFNNKKFNNMQTMIKKSQRILDYRNQFQNILANINNSEQNQSFVMKNGQQQAISEDMNDEPLQTESVLTNNGQLQAIPEDVNNEQIQAKLKNLREKKNFGTNINEPQAIPMNFIEEIAEKVKQIVLRDMEKDVTTTTIKATTSITTTTTAVPTTVKSSSTKTTVTTTETPSTLHKDITEANNVMKKLMEIINEFKAMQETVKSTTQLLQNITTVNYVTTIPPKSLLPTYPPGIAGFNPYIMKSPFNPKLIEVNPYDPRIVPLPVSSRASIPQNQAPQYMPQWNMQTRNDYQSGAITIQTNADEIAPLAIQITKPLKLINQHIVVTTKKPPKKRKEQERESKNLYGNKFQGADDVRNYGGKFQLHSDVMNKEPFADSLKMHSDKYYFKSRLNKNREKPWHLHEYDDRHIKNLPRGSSYPDSVNYPGSLSHTDNLGHPTGFSHSISLSYPGGFSHSENFNHPVIHHDEISHRNRISNQDGTHQDGIRHNSGSHSYTDYERQSPRYEGTKFHEKLERIENRPRNGGQDFRVLTTENCCNVIPARQQIPLMKDKQRSRYDDTHFTNFLKSQQKVTDMLEKILATNMRTSGPHSVETP